MRGLTEEEAEALRDQLDAFDPIDSPTASPQRMMILDRLVNRGLLVVNETEWVPDPDVENGECTYEHWDVTWLGRIALACHAAISSGMVPS